MKSDFITMYQVLKTTEKTDFEDYIFYFYKQQKAVLNTFKDVAKTMVEKEENQLIELIKKNKKTQNDLSDLKKWLIEFITIQEIKNNSYEAKFLTLEALRKREMRDILTKKTTELRAELTADSSYNSNRQSLMKLGLDHAAYFNTENDKLEANVRGDILQLMDGLDNFYMTNKLKYSTELQNRADILKEQYEPRLLSEILTLIDADKATLNPIIHTLYLPLFKLISEKSETAFDDIKAFLIKNAPLDRVEKLLILLNLLNFCAYRIRKSDKKYQFAFLELVQLGLEQSLFTAAGFFPTRTFNNIVSVSSFVGQYRWAEKFIDDWYKYLNPDDAFIARNFALARLNFAEEKFDAAVDLLQELVNHKNIHFSFDIRALLARAYYEKGEKEAFQNDYCNALELYMRRIVGINETLRKSVMNFIKILRFLINKKPKIQVLDALNSLLETEAVLHHEWLIIKIEASQI